MTELILMRHGTTQASLSGLYCGSTDLPLTRRGIGDIKKTARLLSKRRPDCVYCSDKLRARQTAQLIARGVNTIFLSSLREMDFGAFEGMGADEIQSRLPDAWQAYMDDYMSFTFPGGDNVQSYLTKTVVTLNSIIEDNQNQCVLVVTHKGFILSAMSQLLHGGSEHIFRYDIRPAGFARIEVHDGFSVLRQLI